MPLADLTYADEVPNSLSSSSTARGSLVPGEVPPAGSDMKSSAAFFCDEAINALGAAMRAIIFNDVPARCSAVSTATEAATYLYLQLDAKTVDAPMDDAGCSYGALLTHLVHINLHNDMGATGAAIALLTRLRDGIVRPVPATQASSSGQSSNGAAIRQALTRTL